MIYLVSAQKKVQEHSWCWDTTFGVSDLTVQRDCDSYQETSDEEKRDWHRVEIKWRAEEV